MHKYMVFFPPEVSSGIIEDKVITANSAAPWSENEASVTNQDGKTLDFLYHIFILSHKITDLLNVNFKQRSLDVCSVTSTELLEESLDYQKLFQNPSLESICSGKPQMRTRQGHEQKMDFMYSFPNFHPHNYHCVALHS